MCSRLLVFSLAAVAGCGASSTSPTGLTTNGNTSASGSGKTMTATYNGTAYNPNIMTSAWNAGTVAITATDGTRALTLAGLNVNAPGTYSFAPGNTNSGTVQWVDPTGF